MYGDTDKLPDHQCECGCVKVYTKHGWLCLHCDLNKTRKSESESTGN